MEVAGEEEPAPYQTAATEATAGSLAAAEVAAVRAAHTRLVLAVLKARMRYRRGQLALQRAEATVEAGLSRCPKIRKCFPCSRWWQHW